jgi:hypothetical protein
MPKTVQYRSISPYFIPRHPYAFKIAVSTGDGAADLMLILTVVPFPSVLAICMTPP